LFKPRPAVAAAVRAGVRAGPAPSDAAIVLGAERDDVRQADNRSSAPAA
jgi:hypothetical protein